MDTFENLLLCCKNSIERYVHYKISFYEDAEDILQEIYFTAFRKFGNINNEKSFKPWLISIARNKCNDYYRKKSKSFEIPVDEITDNLINYSIFGRTDSPVMDTLELLDCKDKQILYLYYFKNLQQTEIAENLDIPVGTVKSRLYKAKQNFKEKYPYQPKIKGELHMKKLPEYLPECRITKINQEPFSVKCEELMGWLIVPKEGEKLCWGIYDASNNKLNEYTNIEVVGKAEVHGIEGTEIKAVQHNASDKYDTGSIDSLERTFVAQLTETHSRYLAESHMENGIRKCYTFLDGDAFLKNWGYGKDNCGNETKVTYKGLISVSGKIVTTKENRKCHDVAGRYEVEINGKVYDTVCVMDIEYFDDGIVIIQFIDRNGRTVLWQRYNKDDWHFSKHQEKWSSKLPQNEKLIINGETFVHWYNCISDYIV